MKVIRSEYIRGTLSIRAGDAYSCQRRYRALLPALNFITPISDRDAPEDEIVSIDEFWWAQERSDGGDALLWRIAQYLVGEADILLTWEDGSRTGVRVRDRQLFSCQIRVELIESSM